MANNVMNEYIELTEKHMIQYMKLIFQNKFDSSVFSEFWASYLDVRYYDLNGFKNDTTLKNEIIEELDSRKIKLLGKAKGKEKIIEDTYSFFAHLIYLDRVSPNKDLGKTLDDITGLRIELLGKAADKDFRTEIGKVLKENQKEVDELFETYKSTDFYVSVSNYKTSAYVYKVTLKYNFKMPMVYSLFAINKAFNTGTVGEDRLFIEYTLMSVQIIQDIVRGNFKKQYIVDFADTLFDKRQKLERLFKLIENPVIQDKLMVKIPYEMFIKNKDLIYRLMKRGFRFAIIIDDTFEGTLDAIAKLNVFKYILVNENTKWFHNIIDNIDEKNIIEI